MSEADIINRRGISPERFRLHLFGAGSDLTNACNAEQFEHHDIADQFIFSAAMHLAEIIHLDAIK